MIYYIKDKLSFVDFVCFGQQQTNKMYDRYSTIFIRNEQFVFIIKVHESTCIYFMYMVYLDVIVLY